ncbi:MAG: TetR family transcriptional regulator C-terminal domain-containing protein, partial [Aestuariivirgaceae bacterium]
LYNAYGNKQELYTRCLETFGERYGQQLVKQLDNPDFRAGIEGFFTLLVERLESKSLPKGCLATMAAMEIGGGTSLAAKRVKTNLETVRTAFADRCAQAVADGQVPADTDCEAFAAMLLAMTRGIAVLNRGHPDPEVVRAAKRGILATLDRA